MTDKIPDDVRERANRLRITLSNMTLTSWVPEAGTELIAAAIMAERERCAKIAEDADDDGWSESFLPSEIATEQSARIAAAIRGIEE